MATNRCASGSGPQSATEATAYGTWTPPLSLPASPLGSDTRSDDEGHRRFQLRSLSHRCLSFYRNRTEHRLTHHAPMNPQLLGDPSNRSTAMLILTSNLLE